MRDGNHFLRELNKELTELHGYVSLVGCGKRETAFLQLNTTILREDKENVGAAFNVN